MILPASAKAQNEEQKVMVFSDGELESDLVRRVAWTTNGLRVVFGDLMLTAREGFVNYSNNTVVASGDVRVVQGPRVWAGERIEYDLTARKFVGEGFKTGQWPHYARGEALVADQKAGVYVVARGMATTDDFETPGYSVRARTIIIVPNEYVEAQEATVRLGDVPVFYFPRYRRYLHDRAPRFTFLPGYRSEDGLFLLSSYNWYWSERLEGALHVDGRSKRGVGVGPDFNYHLPRLGEGSVKYYYLNDSEPGEDIAGQPIDPDRHRVYFTHRGELWTNLTVRSAIRWQSDAYVVRDFFESEYKKNTQPGTFVELNQRWSNFTLDVLAQAQVNEFQETVERLPEVKLTGLRQRILNTPLYYESDSSLGYYEREFANTDTNNLPYAALRADTYHQVVLPLTFFGWLNLTPRVGGRFTHYGETDGAGSPLGNEDRAVFNTGAEVSFKASRLWTTARSRLFAIDGVRHIVQPSFNYAYVPNPSVSPRKLPQFDYELATTRLLPLDFPDYSAIDSIDSQNVLRLGLRNKLQTKRRDGVDNLLNWALYTDWRLDRRPNQNTFSDVYSDLDLKPFSWLVLSSELRYDLETEEWSEANNTATFLPGDVWSFSVGQRFLQDSTSLGPGNNLFFTSIYYRFTEDWAARLSLRYEADDRTLEEQQYTIYRDFRSWTGALTFRVRDDREGPKDYTVAVTFSLKAHPRHGVGDDTSEPELLLGN
ncbi:MAG TPA: LPS assembly protein LptD [Methylomirabilota bacterium]|nr:LPS assembly protein LptD [Methylomirabilota bacterium]